MTLFLSGIKQDYNLNELHFTDIYSGRGIWKKESVEKRIEIFDLMAMLISKLNLPIFFQSFSDEFRNDHRDFWDYLDGIGLNFWNFQKTEHIGYFLLLLQLKNSVKILRKQSRDFNNRLQIYTDVGLAKENAEVALPIKSDDIFYEVIKFQSSEATIGLQIADFVAFVISKSQRIQLEKKAGENFSDSERHILSIVAKLNHWSLDLNNVDPINFSKEGYEFLLMKDRKEKGLPLMPKKF